MANKITNTAYYQAIANALRAKYEDNLLTFTPAQMAAAITNLPSGGDLDGYLDGSLTELDTEITEIAAYACHANPRIAQLYAYSAETIGEHAFEGCTNLEEVHIEAAQTVGAYAFSGCPKIQEIDLSELLTTGESAFNGCTGLERVEATEATEFGVSTFYGCTSLETVEAPNLSMINNNVFCGCTNLQEVDFPNAWAGTNAGFWYGTAAFKDSGLVTADFPRITHIPSSFFYHCVNLQGFDFSNIVFIQNNAFYGCTSFLCDDFPANITQVGNSAFSGCTSLTTPKIRTQSIGESVFYGCTGLTKVWLSSDVLSIRASGNYYCPFGDCRNLTDIYCEASSKPGNWGSYFDYNGTGRATVHYGVSESDFDAIIAA